MRNLAILLILVSGALQAQTTFKSLQNYPQKDLNFSMDGFTTRNLQPIEICIPPTSFGQVDPLSKPKFFTPNQYTLGYPSGNFVEDNQLLLGTSLTNTLKLGRKSIQTTYFFDAAGNLTNSQTSFSIGKGN